MKKWQIAPNLNGGESVRDGEEKIVEAGLLPGQGVQLLLQAGLLLLVELLLVELLLAVNVELVTKLLLEDLDRVLLLAQQQVPAEKRDESKNKGGNSSVLAQRGVFMKSHISPLFLRT